MPKIVDREEMQGTILDGAMKAFTNKGYHASTIADVAEAAGLGKGTLYLYFKNKDAIVEAMVDRHFATMGEQFRSKTRLDSLEGFLDGLSKSMDVPDAHARFVRVFFEVFGPSFASESFTKKVSAFFDKLGAHYASTLEMLKQVGEVRSDVDTAAAGRVLASLVDGMILHRGLFGIPRSRNVGLRTEAIDMFLRGLRPEPPQAGLSETDVADD